MKVGILTQPLKTNYGGLLQAYALQESLKILGHNTWIIDRDYSHPNLQKKILNKFKRIIPFGTYSLPPTSKEKEVIDQYTSYFRKRYISPTTEKITRSSEMTKLENLGFEAFVVGSDQVWRPGYSPCITNYFLDFVACEKGIKRISYAASFGVKEWEFSEQQTKECSSLARMFNAVSVREASGIDLCKKYLGIDAVHVLDPTMLLNSEDYINLVNNEEELDSSGDLMTYVLDITNEKEVFIKKIAENLGLTPFTVMQQEKLTRKTEINNSIFPPVTRWLKGFMDAKFVITDSFHGCVFSILFNKPFIALGNKNRGLARFESLLKTFKLENRLITEFTVFNEEIFCNNFDWDYVNNILDNERNKSYQFLKNSLDKVKK